MSKNLLKAALLQPPTAPAASPIAPTASPAAPPAITPTAPIAPTTAPAADPSKGPRSVMGSPEQQAIMSQIQSGLAPGQQVKPVMQNGRVIGYREGTPAALQSMNERMASGMTQFANAASQFTPPQMPQPTFKQGAYVPLFENPAFKQIVQKVRENGLHKVAEHLYGEEITIKLAVQNIATQWIYNERKYQKIASGLAALNNVETLQKKGQMFRMMAGGVKRALPEAGKAIEATMPETLQAARKGISGLPASGLKQPIGKTTFRGIETPPLAQLPTKMPASITESKAPLFGQYAR